ncbi:MAG: hypothetical protein AAFU85_14745 [Planctomycetota bacterium]
MPVIHLNRILFAILVTIGAGGHLAADEPVKDAQATSIQHFPMEAAIRVGDLGKVSTVSYETSLPPLAFPPDGCSNSETDCNVGRIDFAQYAMDPSAQACRSKRPLFCDHYARADLIFLSREDTPYSLAFTTLGGTTAPIELNHGFAPGVRATIGTRTGTTGRFEVSYLGINDWSADNRTSNLPFGAGSLLSSIDEYSANLNDLQLNLIAMDPYSHWDWIFGLRIVDQRDELSSLVTVTGPGAAVERLEADAANTLLGLQGGTNYGRHFGPVSFHGGAKVGVFGNFIAQSGPIFVNNFTIDSVPEPTFDTEDDATSFMGDFIAEFAYHPVPSMSLHLGYQGLIFTNIVQSAQQDGSPSRPDTLAYHGIYAGFELRR